MLHYSVTCSEFMLPNNAQLISERTRPRVHDVRDGSLATWVGGVGEASSKTLTALPRQTRPEQPCSHEANS